LSFESRDSRLEKNVWEKNLGSWRPPADSTSIQSATPFAEKLRGKGGISQQKQ